MRTSNKIVLGVVILQAGVLASWVAHSQEAGPEMSQLEEVIVTAQRRDEPLQKLPIAADVLSGQALSDSGITNIADVTYAVPSLQFQRNSFGMAPFIRGIGNNNGGPGDEAAVGVYVDGVYYASLAGGIFALNNVERVEVLEGPQGTLFGRNSTGGVIQIVTKDPSHTPSADLSVGYGNYNTTTGTFYGTTGITDNLAADLAVYANNQESGWGNNLTTGQPVFKGNEVELRSKWLWDLDSATSIKLTGEYDNSHPLIPPLYTPPVGGYLIGATPVPYRGFYDVAGNENTGGDVETWGANIQIRHDFNWAKFVSISAYRNVDASLLWDQDGTPAELTNLNVSQYSHTWTQEFQLLSPSQSQIKWIVGTFYYNDHSAYAPLIEAGSAVAGGGLSLTSVLRTTSYAGYGQATVPIVDATNLTLGVRYTSDSSDIDGRIAEPALHVAGSTSSDKVTWRAALDHQFTDALMGYLSDSRGYKSGLFNTTNPFSPTYTLAPAVLPETVDTYEIGLKSQFLHDRLEITADGFLNHFKNIQVKQIVTGGTEILNAAAAHINGAELKIRANPLENLTLGAGLTYLDSHYTDFPDAPGLSPVPITMLNTTKHLTTLYGGNDSISVNATGNQTILTSPWVTTLNGQYRIPAAYGAYTIGANYYYNDGYFFDFQNRARQQSYNLVDGFAEWSAPGDKYSVRLWADNIGDTHYLTAIQPQNYGDTTTPAAPRTYGVKFSYHF